MHYLQKGMGYEIDSITLGVHSQACPKHLKNKFTISLQYLKDNVNNDVDLCLLIIVKGFFKVILWFFMCVARHAQITQNKKFAISLQYLKKVVNDEVDFLHAGKNKNLIQIDTIILMGMVKHFESSQNSKFAMPLQYLKIEVRDEVDFYMQINIKVAYKLLSTLLAPKFPKNHRVILSLLMSMMKHSQRNQSKTFENLHSISKKLGMEFIFCIQTNIIKVSKS